jgi:hypothetical protein
MHKINLSVRAIRAIDSLDCEQLHEIMNVIASKMHETGFSDLDLTAIDEAANFICGETV